MTEDRYCGACGVLHPPPTARVGGECPRPAFLAQRRNDFTNGVIAGLGFNEISDLQVHWMADEYLEEER